MTDRREVPEIHIEPTDSPSPSPIPTHVRPHSTRHSSYSSTGSSRSRRPHAQQQEYVPIGEPGPVGLDERWQFEQAEDEAAEEHGSSDGDEDEEEEEEEPAWDNLRDGSVSRRPAWRRASPRWLYPFIVGATLSMGMGVAPKQELYINLACLAHPPQQPRSGDYDVRSAFGMQIVDGQYTDIPTWNPDLDGDMTINTTIPSSNKLPVYHPTPADEWFKKIQREIYDYEINHRYHVNGTEPATTTTKTQGHTTPTAYPSSPLPRPHDPSDGSDEPEPRPTEPGREQAPPRSRPPYHEIDPRMCKKDPKVQAASARMTMIITLTSGILSALTTGYWGQMSDRIGRSKILAITELGMCLNEIAFILVATFPYLAPGGFRALLIGPTLDGLLGSLSTLTATINAYISDVTPDGSRAAVFARLTGTMMLGFATGPVLGSFVIKWTGNIMVPFYFSVVIHTIYVILMLFVLPESLSSDSRQILKKHAEEAREAAKRQDALDRQWEATPAKAAARAAGAGAGTEREPLLHNDSTFSRISTSSNNAAGVNHSRRRKKIVGNAKRTLRRVFAFLQPLTVFAPRETEDGRKDWNLTKVGAGMFLIGCLMGVLPSKAQFAMYNYGWTSAELGPYMSLSGYSRGIVLLVIVPLILRQVKPYFYPPLPESLEPAIPTDDPATPAVKAKRKRPIILDLWTIRVSMTLELIPYIGLAFNPSQTGFIILSTLVTFGSASSPTANSLALSLLPNQSEAGRLFGGLAVLHALGATIVSPLMYGTAFAATVGTYAPTIFVLAAINLFLAWILFALVRLEKKGDDAERGRSRRVKTVRSSSHVLAGPSGRAAPRRKAGNGQDSTAIDTR